MDPTKIFKENLQPTVFIFSKYDAFSLYLVENLLANSCNVAVFTDNIKVWKSNTTHITKTGNLIIDEENNYTKYPKPDYFLVVDFLDKGGNKLIEKIEYLSRTLNSKGFVVTSENCNLNHNIKLPETIGVVLLNNLFGPRMNLGETSRLVQIFCSAMEKRTTTIFEEEKISPLYMGDAAKTLVKWMFSFGPYGKIVLLSSTKISVLDVCKIVERVYPDFKYRVSRGRVQEPEAGTRETYLFKNDSSKILEETLLWFKNNNRSKETSPKTKHKRILAIKIFVILLLIMAAPFAFILLAASLLYLSQKQVNSGNLKTARYINDSACVISNISNIESKTFVKTPLLDKLYKPAFSFSYILINLCSVGQKGYGLIENGSELADNILGEEEYNIEDIQKNITSNLNYIETKLSFTEGELKNYPNWYKKIDISQIRKIVSSLGKISPHLSELLGVNASKTYLILFQNNMELRPTGGFIGSFALVNFNSGRLNEISVQDVYSADGQLKGHIEPPIAIEKYLGEANWFLRDSNWNPDFSASAIQAEWFLEKEIDILVDGVIAIDLNVIKDILEITGPIYLTDYQTQISSDNFYEKIQGEVENSFFPGSTKKANYITALTKELINTLLANKESNKIKYARIIYDNFETRHIQTYFHNIQVKEALAKLNWNGSFNYPACSGNCLSDFLGIVEANLGVNKANYYIQRNYNLSINLNKNTIIKNLSITYKNTSDLAMGNRGVYKNYARVVVPLNSTLNFIKLGDSQVFADIETVSGRKEIGFYFELPPAQTKTVNISWNEPHSMNFTETGEYLLYIRKQAGTPSEPIVISVNAISGVDLKVEHGYNTLFAKDIFSKITWKK